MSTKDELVVGVGDAKLPLPFTVEAKVIDSLLADMRLRISMLRASHATIISRGKRVAASSDFQYDLACYTGMRNVCLQLAIVLPADLLNYDFRQS